ncbi:hypothetical protein QBC37DRAFT_301368 [Rhypophila decipiens]|uniref:Uncharacterized protein n=1 Tax=Rhypophila decipiens TaxID=261697 RepID=A0AAN7B0V1_9PEZI|nr:hypothetical protein QBC37DRAFT_301368 [Rhypophila decipiens]
MASPVVTNDLTLGPSIHENGTITNNDHIAVLPLSPSHGNLQARDGCVRQGTLNVQHAVNMANELQNNNPDALPNAPKRSWNTWSWGEARICIYNNYYFENTHVKRFEVGWVIRHIYNLCCNPGGNSMCAGSDSTCHGDSGLSLKAVLQNSAYSC